LDRALAHAVAVDDLASVRALLAEGADVNARADEGETVLMTAALLGRTAIVQCLVAEGADLEAKDRRRETALMKADQHGHEAIVHLLKQAEATD
jgi:ankyrin repeat protein